MEEDAGTVAVTEKSTARGENRVSHPIRPKYQVRGHVSDRLRNNQQFDFLLFSFFLFCIRDGFILIITCNDSTWFVVRDRRSGSSPRDSFSAL
jgi:hypothetical protein